MTVLTSISVEVSQKIARARKRKTSATIKSFRVLDSYRIALEQFGFYKMLFPFLFSSFPDQAYNWTNVPVDVITRGALTVEFCSSRDRDENNLLCKMTVTVPPQQRDPDVGVVFN